MTRLLRLLPLAVLLLASLAAQADEGDWYVAPSIVYFDDDPDRLIDDTFGGLQIQVGRGMSDRFWLEGLLGYNDIDGYPGSRTLQHGIVAASCESNSATHAANRRVELRITNRR